MQYPNIGDHVDDVNIIEESIIIQYIIIEILTTPPRQKIRYAKTPDTISNLTAVHDRSRESFRNIGIYYSVVLLEYCN